MYRLLYNSFLLSAGEISDFHLAKEYSKSNRIVTPITLKYIQLHLSRLVRKILFLALKKLAAMLWEGKVLWVASRKTPNF